MTVVIKKQFNRLPWAPIIAVLAAIIAFALAMLTPDWVLNKIIAKTGLASIVAAAAPPLGTTAKLMIAAGAAIAAAIGSLIVLVPLSKRLQSKRSRPLVADPVDVAKGDALDLISEAPEVPDRYRPKAEFQSAPIFSRPPIFAERELGVPFMAETAVPAAIEPVAVVLQPNPQGIGTAAIEVQEDVPFFSAPSFSTTTPVFDAPQPFEPVSAFDDALDLEFAQIADIPDDQPEYGLEALEGNTPKVEAPAPIFLSPVEPVAAQTPINDDWTVGIPLPVEDGYEMPAAPKVEVAAQMVAATASATQTEVEAPASQKDAAAEATPEPYASPSPTFGAEISISELLERFETGLRRRQLQSLVASSTLTGAGSSAAAADAALGQALDTLERLAAHAR